MCVYFTKRTGATKMKCTSNKVKFIHRDKQNNFGNKSGIIPE